MRARFEMSSLPHSLQLGVFDFGLLQDGNVGVRVFPEREKIAVGSAGIGGVALDSVGASEAEMRQRPDGFVKRNSAMVEDFLELSGRLAALMGRQIGFAANVYRIHGSPAVAAVSRLS